MRYMLKFIMRYMLKFYTKISKEKLKLELTKILSISEINISTNDYTITNTL